jgi:hypothetical protein
MSGFIHPLVPSLIRSTACPASGPTVAVGADSAELYPPRPPACYPCPMSGEPANFNARAMGRWLASRDRGHAKWQPAGPPPTLTELQRSHCWTWVYCEKCLHHAPMALVPLMIRWGAETSSDRLRQRARCTKCRHKGATLQRPGWAGTHIGFQPFPVPVDSSQS